MTALVAALALALSPTPALSDWDRANLERNLRWMLARDRAPTAGPRVGVFADAGVWHPGARAIVTALEADGVPCRVLDRSALTAHTLDRLAGLVLPGGWAPHQRAAAGPLGLAAVRRFAECGGTVVGVCAGAYLLSATVTYEGVSFPYPVGLFDGAAVGPVPGLARFPTFGTATLTPTGAGRTRGLGVLAGREVAFGGGPCFVGGTGVMVLATYPDGSAAVISRRIGRGEVILIGAHPEVPAGPTGRVYAALLR
jgi:glutamine amidotransferase-like uncharacterized protein